MTFEEAVEMWHQGHHANAAIQAARDEIEQLRKQVQYAYVEVQYVLAGLAGVALRVAPNDEHMDSVIDRLAKLKTALTPNAEAQGREASPGAMS